MLIRSRLLGTVTFLSGSCAVTAFALALSSCGTGQFTGSNQITKKASEQTPGGPDGSPDSGTSNAPGAEPYPGAGPTDPGTEPLPNDPNKPSPNFDPGYPFDPSNPSGPTNTNNPNYPQYPNSQTPVNHPGTNPGSTNRNESRNESAMDSRRGKSRL